MFSEPAKDPPGAEPSRIDLERPKLLKWVIDSKISEAIEHAEETATSIARDSDAMVLIFDGYGSEYIKSHGIQILSKLICEGNNLFVGKVSPDAFVQMVLQLAYYRMHGTWTATYETASTRQYRLGRTETIRTCSPDSCAFLQAFTDPSLNVGAHMNSNYRHFCFAKVDAYLIIYRINKSMLHSKKHVVLTVRTRLRR